MIKSYHCGKYKFNWPYLGFSYPQNMDGEIEVNNTEVEVYIGNESDYKQGIYATIIITSDLNGLGVTNFIDDIATKIRYSFFDKFFHEFVFSKTIVGNDQVRWIQHNLSRSENQSCDWSEVTFTWDEEIKRYTNPKWNIYNGEYKIENETYRPE